MTLETFQNRLHVMLEGDTDYPTDGDDDWEVRLDIANIKLTEWENKPGILWRELWTENTNGGTVTAGDTTYAAPVAMKQIGGYVKLTLTGGTSSYLPVIMPENAQKAVINTEKAVYVTGQPGAYILNLTWTPVTGDTEIDATISYPYYQLATLLSNTTDVIVMSDPTWLLDATASELKKQDADPLYSVYEARSQAKMRAMKAANELLPLNNSTAISDDFIGFGV
jgi:hypothetical protein